MRRDLVLLHGWAMRPRVFSPVLPMLGDGRRVHNLSLPGYGCGEGICESGAQADPGGSGQAILDRWSDECLAAAPAGGVWLGWSLGAMIAVNAALRAPGRIEALVLVSATPKFLREPSSWEAGAERPEMGDLLHAVRMGDRKALRRFVLLQAGRRDNALALGRVLTDCMVDPGAAARTLEAGLEVLGQVDLRARLRELDPPVLAIHGLDDRIVPVEAGAYIAGKVPRGDLVTLETGHAPFATRPREFGAAVLSWI
ncbi:MAG: alpha/beta fold hydrolase [Arenicellales bacterium]